MSLIEEMDKTKRWFINNPQLREMAVKVLEMPQKDQVSFIIRNYPAYFVSLMDHNLITPFGVDPMVYKYAHEIKGGN